MKRKVEAVQWKEFFQGQVIPKQEVSRTAVILSGAVYLTILPTRIAFAAQDDTWGNIWGTVLHLSDWLCVGVISFAGAVWMFGNRSKALELLIGASSGYLVIRHAMDIKNWLASL